MKIRSIYILAFIAAITLWLSLGSIVRAEFYRWTDAEGNVHYSSAPPVGDEVQDLQKIKDENLPTLTTTPALTIEKPSSNTGNKESIANAATYNVVAIEQPGDESSIRENAGNVTVSIHLEPALNASAGHLLAVYMDGAEITVGTSTSVTIPNVDRGTHKVQAKVLNARGKVIASSPSHTFTLHRYSSKFAKPPPSAKP